MDRSNEEPIESVAPCAGCGGAVLLAFAAVVPVTDPEGERVEHFHETCLHPDDRSGRRVA